MRSRRRVLAVLTDVARAPMEPAEPLLGLALGFRPERTRLAVERLEDVIPLGPGLTVAVALGLAKLVRLLRAARVAPPSDASVLVDRPDLAEALLERALGARVELEIRPRSTIRFTVWTEHGVETLSDVLDVTEDEHAYLVRRRAGRFPVRIEREHVVRQRTECHNWYEITEIERPG